MQKNTKLSAGNTELRRLHGMRFDGFNGYLKDEGLNPYGTVKDRRNIFIAHEAQRLRVDKLALITAGSSGYSLAMIAAPDIKVTAIVDRMLPASTKEKIAQVAYQVTELNLQHKILRPEEVVAFAREREDEVIWDVTNGYEESYVPIVAELKDLAPDFIVVPIGSGGVYVGIVDGVQRYRLPTKVIGIGVQNTMRSFADKLHTPWTPYSKIMAKFHDLGHTIHRLTEPEVKAAWHEYQHVARLEPSSAVVFAAIGKQAFRESDKVVFVNTGALSF